MSAGPSYKFAYYCSGHGFGHATRVVATSEGLLARNHTVSIVSSAPKSVFQAVLEHPSKNISYRFAIFEPTVVQPKAYDVDRLATFHNIDKFLTNQRNELIQKESEWLIDNQIQCVLVDAPSIPCVAASQANIPSVIISNFTFDSCYAYLSAFDLSEETGQNIDLKKLNDLVTITTRDYSHADLLLRLPGPLPIPAFDLDIEPSVCDWIDNRTGSFTSYIDQRLARPTSERLGKKVFDIPLIVRPLTDSAFDPKTKLALLRSLRVPSDLLKIETKILLVSFGGQVIPRPKSTPDHNVNGQAPRPSPEIDGLLPSGWIAIVCGLSSTGLGSDMPEGFYSLSDSNFDYLPDLTVIGDVVLGKLGYGTCSEVIAARTPFISVPRKKFLEEYGLKRLMKQHSVTNIEMSIEDFEDGRWAKYVILADKLGHQSKVEFLEDLRGKHSRTKPPDSDGVLTVIDHLDYFLSHKLPS